MRRCIDIIVNCVDIRYTNFYNRMQVLKSTMIIISSYPRSIRNPSQSPWNSCLESMDFPHQIRIFGLMSFIKLLSGIPERDSIRI